MKKISIIGATILGNRGAEAMLITTIGRIREKHSDANFYIYSYYPKDDRKLIKDKKITVHSATPLYLISVLFPLSMLLWFFNLLNLTIIKEIMPSSIKNLADSDVLIDLAGVSFMDGRSIFLPFNILTIWPAMLVKTPVVKFAQGLGPFNQITIKIAAKLFLPKCKQLFARGEITQEYLKKIFPNTQNFQQASDIAFSHKIGDSLSIENSNYINDMYTYLNNKKKDGKYLVGLCPSSVVLSKSKKTGIDYIETFEKLIVSLLKNKNIHVLLFPNASRQNDIGKLRNNDLPVIQEIIQRLEKNQISCSGITYVSKDINTDSIKKILQLCDVTAVSRFHAMIASLSLHIPVIVLGWSHKYHEVMKQFNMEQWVIDYSKQDIDLSKTLFEMLKEKEKLKKTIQNHIIKVKKDSYLQFDYIFSKILD